MMKPANVNILQHSDTRSGVFKMCIIGILRCRKINNYFTPSDYKFRRSEVVQNLQLYKMSFWSDVIVIMSYY